MKIIEYSSNAIIPIIITIIIGYGLFEKKNVFDIFLLGAKEGIEIVIKMIPTLIGIFLAIGALRSSGIIEEITKIISPITNLIGIPKEIIPLSLIRPISGSGSIGVATDIMQQYGVDSKIGKIASTIMGSTETTLYIIAIYTSSIEIKKTRFVLVAALVADIVGMLTAVLICNIMS